MKKYDLKEAILAEIIKEYAAAYAEQLEINLKKALDIK